MCGICGFVGPRDDAVLGSMARSLQHRGPDAQNLWSNEVASLGMRRLAIVDIESGEQPIFNEDQSIVLVFNGEIYNSPQLRRSLQRNGHDFRSDHGDGEVIPHLYEEHGENFAEHLHGMFAIALWDVGRRKLILVRDRIGIKPLYYAHVGNSLLFASEIKALFHHPALRKKPDFQSLWHYFSFKNISSPHTAYTGIHQLSPGEMAVFADSSLRTNRWWQLRFRENLEISATEAATRTTELLSDSVKSHLLADVNVGAFLSGGVDSSAIVALASTLSATPIKTFTLIYDHGHIGKDEDRRYAQLISKQYRTDHFEYVLRPSDLEEELDNVITSFDEPFSGVISTFFLSKFIARHVKVALSGDGADELFGSYLPHRLSVPLFCYRALLATHSSIEHNRAMLVPFDDEIGYLSQLAMRGDEASARMAQYVFDDASKHSLLSGDFFRIAHLELTETLTRLLYSRSRTGDPLNRSLFVDFETLLPDQVLTFVDRLSMAHSLEIRPPFLDHRLVEFTSTLPAHLKIRGSTVKSILKTALQHILPSPVLERPKEGFIMPINDWMMTHLSGLLDSVLSPNQVSGHGLFKTNKVLEILSQFRSGQRAFASQVWTIFMFQLWWNKHFGN